VLGVRFYSVLRALLLLVAVASPQQVLGQVPVPELIAIPQGAFLMGSEEGASWEKPVHKVEVSAFWIAKRPVTNGQYRGFRPDHHSPVDDADTAAVRGVSWEDATAYSQWLRDQTGAAYRLPTEAEWERAVRGGLEQKKYPWGDEPAVPEDKVGSRAAWPAAPPNGFGLLIEHELWEWTADLYDRSYYQLSPPKDPQGSAEGEFRVLRGGSYPNDPNSMRCSNRGSARPKTELPNVTFRIAREGTPGELTELRRPPATGSGNAAREPSTPAQASAPPPVSTRPAQRSATQPAATQPPAVTTVGAPVASALVPAGTAVPASRVVPDVAPARSLPSRSLPGPAGPTGGPVGLTRVDVTVSSAQVILALSLTGAAEFTTMMLTSPDRVVIDLANTSVATDRQYGSIDVADLGVERVRWAPFQAANARIVIDLTQPVSYAIESAASGLVVRLKQR
jgi:formylglycine-generating enzyme required for sulfatase activity